ncbi:hypothetical protein B9479_001201 [Cryptococcus floricola]|uniref:Subtelomeric hrmA-associated cluster protein AFUB-079030/YDR124W-like helical bundle domain-containing protein n=1 Tax=Cryptococcus floricola TaxID=2591691 RepID=A0A5D3B2Z1_9TREE|nr:hypothetical protein B9479_001201 [Cryptococcus floricola]
MPRIAARTETYDTIRECNRHYRAKRDHILHMLGKASYIDGSQFLITFISPKGEIHSFQSTLLKEPFETKQKVDEGGGLLNMDSLKYHAAQVKHKLKQRREEEGKSNAQIAPGAKGKLLPVGSDDEDEDDVEDDDADDIDPDRTLVEPPTPAVASSSKLPSDQDKTVFTIQPDDIVPYYEKRFSSVQQEVCKQVAKAWIKVVEPKKQSRFPYNKGDKSKPKWWPKSIEHRAPDHLTKEQRLSLLIHMLRGNLAKVADLELSVATIMAWLPADKLEIIREICLVARADEVWRASGKTDRPLVLTIPDSLREVWLAGETLPRYTNEAPLGAAAVRAATEGAAAHAAAMAEAQAELSQAMSSASAPPVEFSKSSLVEKTKKRPSPLGISDKLNVRMPAPKRQRSTPSINYTPVHPNDYNWRPQGYMPNHQPPFTPLGLHLHDPNPYPPPFSHVPLGPQHHQAPPPHVHGHMGEHAPRYHHVPPIMTRHHSMGEPSPIYLTPAMASPMLEDFSNQQGEAPSFMYIDPSITQPGSAGIDPSSQTSSTSLSAPTPTSAPPALSQPIPGSADFSRSGSQQGYMQQQQMEYLEAHTPQGYEYLAPTPHGDTGFERFYEGESFDYGMPVVSDQVY